MEISSRAYTKEEVQDIFLENVINLVNYWENNPSAESTKDKLEGLAFSILSILDGECNDMPGFSVKACSCSEDIDFAKENEENYFPLESDDIAGTLHERFVTLCQ